MLGSKAQEEQAAEALATVLNGEQPEEETRVLPDDKIVGYGFEHATLCCDCITDEEKIRRFNEEWADTEREVEELRTKAEPDDNTFPWLCDNCGKIIGDPCPAEKLPTPEEAIEQKLDNTEKLQKIFRVLVSETLMMARSTKQEKIHNNLYKLFRLSEWQDRVWVLQTK